MKQADHDGYGQRLPNQRGISLVEIMVALVIGLVLTTGIIQIFLGTKASYRAEQGLARVQETGRFATAQLSREIRMAGYQGCLNASEIEPNIMADSYPDASDITLEEDRVVEGSDNVSGLSIGGSAVRPGTDTLTVRYADPASARLGGNMDPTNANIQLRGNRPQFRQDDIVYITDCDKADIFKIVNSPQSTQDPSSLITITHSKGNNNSNFLSKAYKEDAQVMSFQSNTYFVADTGRTNAAGDSVFALYVHDVQDQTYELLEGVENLQVQYGEDQDGDGSVDRYVDASAGPDIEEVIALRVGLLVNSVDVALTNADTNVYRVGGSSITAPGDRLMRKPFTLTATIRNRELRSASFD